MKLFGKTLSVLLGLNLLVALGVGGYFVLKCMVELSGSRDLQVPAVTAIASFVALLAARIIARSIREASTQYKTNQLRAEKVATYQLFIDLWENLLGQGRDSADRSPNTLSEELLTLDHLLILYGSPGVVKSNAVLRMLERDSGAQSLHVRSQVTNVLMEIRKDLGLETQGLTVEELLPLLADADKASAPAKASAFHDLQPRVSLVSRA